MSESELSITELAAALGGQVFGDGSVVVRRIASIERAGAGEVAFVQDTKQLDAARASEAACLIVSEEIAGRNGVVVRHPKLAFARVARLLSPRLMPTAFVHPTAIVAADAQFNANVHVGAHSIISARAIIGDGTQIGDGVIVGNNVNIGRECTIHPNVTIYDNVTIGDRVVLHAGVVIGADGFGYVRDDETGEYIKFPQVGRVVIESDAEIGANTCIDRGALGETRIGAGTKIDNLVQIGHNVSIGRRVVIAAQTGISGSTVIEDDCVIGGQVGFGDHARVERGAIIGSKAGVLPGKIVRGGAVYWGVPVRPLAEYKVMNAHMGRLPQMREELERLRRRIEKLEESVGEEK